MLRVPFSKLETKQQQFERVVKLKHFILFGSPPPTCVFRECVLVLLPVGDPLQVCALLPVCVLVYVCVPLNFPSPNTGKAKSKPCLLPKSKTEFKVLNVKINIFKTRPLTTANFNKTSV